MPMRPQQVSRGQPPAKPVVQEEESDEEMDIHEILAGTLKKGGTI